MTDSGPNGFTLLAVGDLHLGRRPSGLPPLLQPRAAELGPAAAWTRLVDEAIARGVDAVALAGDVVESEDDLFEGYRALAAGVERLAEAGIAVAAVAGNHDVQVLPRLADRIEAFRLLGRGGRWERLTLGGAQQPVTLHGWSFPQPVVDHCPLGNVRLERGPGLNLGLLHCDLDARDSRYAPIARARLQGAGLDGWLLGHIHRPHPLSPQEPLGYLGSVSGLHPGELGDRGPWAVQVAGGRIQRLQQWTLAPLHWQRLTLDLSGLHRASEAEDRLLAALRTLDAELAARARPPEACGLRLRLVGRSRHGAAVQDRLLSDPDRDVSVSGRIAMFIERVELATLPLRDLAALASGSSPVALLAARLSALRGASDLAERQALIAAARRRIESLLGESRWQGLEPPALDDDAVAELLAENAARMLELLLDQQRCADAAESER